MDKDRCLEIDLMKIISCLAVMAIHITARGVTDPASQGFTQNMALLLNGISNFAVPCFIFLSGTALMLRYGGAPLPFVHFMKKRMNSILVPYLGWSFAYFIIYTLGGFYNFDLNNILGVVFLGKGEYHLYFVVILIQLYLLFPLLKTALEWLGIPVTLMLVLALHLGFVFNSGTFPLMDRLFIPYLIFFVPGMVWGVYYGRLKTLIEHFGGVRIGAMVFYLFTAGLYLNARYYPESSLGIWPQLWQVFSLGSIGLLMVISTFFVTKLKTPEQKTTVMTLSTATFYVYLAHPLLIAGIYELSSYVGLDNLSVLLPLNYVLTAGISFWGALGYLKIKKQVQKNSKPRKA